MNSKILHRQLKKLNLQPGQIPATVDQWNNFLKTVDEAYEQYESHLHRSHNTLNVATDEMQRLYKELETRSSLKIQSLDSKLQNIMNTAPCIILWLDQEGRIEACNDYFRQLMQIESPSENQKVSFSSLSLLSLQEKTENFIQSDQLQIGFIKKIQNQYFKFSMNKMIDQNKISVLGFDVTEDINKQNTINQIQANAVQKSKLAVLGELSAGVAHEINNPLMILTSVAFVIQRHIEQKSYDLIPEKLDKIQSTISRISRIVNGLRTYARNGENDPMMPVNIEDIIVESLELCFENIRHQNISIHFENRLSEPTIILCRDTQISQVILNLISNAKDAVLSLEEKWIRITLDRQDKEVVLRFTDSGQGISTELREQIFQPFFTTKDVGNGTGLGLSISSEIIKFHGGKLYIDETSPNTCFALHLPIADLANT